MHGKGVMGMDLASMASEGFALSKRIGLLGVTFLSLSALSIWAVAQPASPSNVPAASAETSTTATAEGYFGLKLTVGQKIGNIFSKSISYKGGGIEESARRISGSALYQVVDPSPDRPRFISTVWYDGRGANTGTVEIRNNGQVDCSVTTGKCTDYLDDSGVIYDAFLWGKPAGKLVAGMSWKVQLSVPWELGPAGTETVTVMRVDPVNHEVMLKREGSGEGSFQDDYDPKQIAVKKDGKEYKVDVVPGTTHWVGFSVFQEGLTVSDELLEARSLTVSAKEFGTSTISERQFTLLNQAPSELL